MDKEIRKLERKAAAGDPEASERLKNLKRRLAQPDDNYIQHPYSVHTIMGRGTGFEHEGIYYELDDVEIDCYYNIDGADEPQTYDYPGSSASWQLIGVKITEKAFIDEYNRWSVEAGEPGLPFGVDDNFIKYLSSEERGRIESELEDEDRNYEPDPDPPDDDDYLDYDDGPY